MATSIRAFNIELYQEHLEEASFLYEQRLGLLNDPELTWKDLDEFEQRLKRILMHWSLVKIWPWRFVKLKR